MNIPNMLTILRIILVPVYLGVFFSNIENRILWAGFVFILAGVSDVLDGYIARRYDLITKLGSVLDPFADKMMTCAVLVSFTWAKLIPSWILFAIGIKEVIMIVGGIVLYLFKGNQVLPSNRYGKIATMSFYMATLSIVFSLPDIISRVLFLLMVLLNILAFINYLIIYIGMRNTQRIS